MKIKFNPNPTFKATVSIPVPGEEEFQELDFTFKHLDADLITRIQDDAADSLMNAKTTSESLKAIVKHIKSIVSGWDLEDDAGAAIEFNDVNLAHMLAYYPGLYVAVSRTFSENFWAVRSKL